MKIPLPPLPPSLWGSEFLDGPRGFPSPWCTGLHTPWGCECGECYCHEWVTLHGIVNPDMDHRDGLDLITSPLKLESFLWLALEEEVRGLKYED